MVKDVPAHPRLSKATDTPCAQQGLTDEVEAFKTSISTRLGMFVRNVSTAIAALIVCKCRGRATTQAHKSHTQLAPLFPCLMFLAPAFVRGWQLTLIIVATMPALMIVSMGVSVFTKKLQVNTNAS